MRYSRFIAVIALMTLVEWVVYALRVPLGLSSGPADRLVPMLLATSSIKFVLVIYWVSYQLKIGGGGPTVRQKALAALLVMGGGSALILWILLTGSSHPI